jgi:thymidine kinase
MSAPVIHFENQTGYLELIISCMFSGKTTLLLNKLNTFASVQLSCLYINHSLDSRSDSSFSTHNPIITSIGSISAMKLDTLSSFDFYDSYDVIGIDEAGFFPDLLEKVLYLVEQKGKRVIVAGLQSDFKRQPLGKTLDLIPYADQITKLSSYCKICAQARQVKEASFSHRMVPSESQILIGMKESYIPLCRTCYLSQQKCLQEKDQTFGDQ